MDGLRPRRLRERLTPANGQIVLVTSDGAVTARTLGHHHLANWAFEEMIPTHLVGLGANKLSVAQLQYLHRRGVGIGAHSHEHVNLTLLEPAARLLQIQTAHSEMAAWGITSGTLHFGPPFAANDDVITDCLATGFTMVLSETLEESELPAGHTYSFQTGYDNRPWATVRGYIDWLVGQPARVLFLFLNQLLITAVGVACSVARLEQIIHYIKQTSVNPVSMRDLV
jgi:peptidoglycan/xylan/chitin deacetylase (PgdA/CDA1 family)